MDLEFVLQALAILFHVFFMVLYPPISCFLVYKLLTGGYFTILLGYLIWLIYDWQTPSQGSRLSMFLRRTYYMKLCQQYFPITLRKTAELDPSKNYIIGHHPHGILSFGATNFCQEYSGFSSLFPGMQSYLSTLKMNFWFPIRREYFEFLGVTDCSKNSIHYLLSQPKKGTAVAVVIGGAEEALEAHPGKHRVVLKSRKGFIKLALHCGASLVPSYSFGEVDVFDQINNEKGSLLRRMQDWFRKIATFSTPIFYGSYVFLPYRRPICTVVGRPIDVEKCEDPTQEQIDRLHEIYVNELLTLFNTYKVSYGLPESAQLEIL